MSDFAAVVRSARQARGWTQRELAQRVGVSQRTVSSWELSASEPDEDLKRLVAAALSLPPEVVSVAVARHPAESGRTHAGRARLAELPLDLLDPREFEDFTVSLLKELYPQAGLPYRLGKSGHKQHGFDVVAEQDGRVRVAVQCKRVMRFGPAEVNRAVTAAEMSADEGSYIPVKGGHPCGVCRDTPASGLAVVGSSAAVPHSARSPARSGRTDRGQVFSQSAI